ncbi:MAG: IMP cyclohydrolase [Desulfobacteraceae bacterium]
MYVGRIVSAGLTDTNRLCVMYRVSSRSFPDRVIKDIKGALSVIPSKGSETDIYKNPYISYNCLRHNSEFAVVGNGTHTDPIFEKLESGMSVRDSLTSALFGMDYEHDDYSTPRIAAVASKSSKKLALGIIRIDGIEIQVFNLKPGEYRFVSTYETNRILTDFGGVNFYPQSSKEAAQYIINGGKFLEFEKPVSAAAAMETDMGFETGYINLKNISYQP